MKKLWVLVLVVLSTSVVAKSEGKYNPKKAGTYLQQQQAKQALGNTYDQKCYYCSKDLSTEYNPSAKKYGKTQQ